LNNYEIMFLISPALEKERLSEQYKAIDAMVNKYNGSVENAQEIGKKPLCYNIKKHKEGVYYLLNIKMESSRIKELQEELKLNENILRMDFNKQDQKTQVKKPVI
jgi:small subunit ribosomal protein S6